MALVPHAQLSHVGIRVVDLDRMVAFYTRVLGFMVTDRGPSPAGHGDFAFLSRDPGEHHQLLLATGRAPGTPSQIVQLSLKMGSLAELRAMHEIVRAEPEAGNIQTRAHGIAWSLYFDDPEDNVVETFVPSPWYLPAPTAVPFSFEMSDAEIFETVRAEVRARPGFKTFEEWRDEATRRMLEAGTWTGTRA